MRASRDLLFSLLKTAQLAQVGIRSVLDTSMEPKLRETLRRQLREYDAIETEACAIACQRGWEPPDIDPAVRFLTDRRIRFRLLGNNTDSRIADIIIRDNTKGMIQGLRNLHRFTEDDYRVRILSQKLLDCETAGIRQMLPFL